MSEYQTINLSTDVGDRQILIRSHSADDSRYMLVATARATAMVNGILVKKHQATLIGYFDYDVPLMVVVSGAPVQLSACRAYRSPTQ